MPRILVRLSQFSHGHPLNLGMTVPRSFAGGAPPDGDRNTGTSLIITSVIVAILAVQVVLARIKVRFLVLKNLGLDDYFITIGLVLIP